MGLHASGKPEIRQTQVEDVEVNTFFCHSIKAISGGGPSILFETTVVGGPLSGQRAKY